MQERLGELIPSGLAPYLCISPPKSLYPDAERPLPDRRYESALPHPLLPKRLPGGLDGGAGSGPAHRVQGGRVLRALHFPTTPDSSSFSNPVTPQMLGLVQTVPKSVHSCRTIPVDASSKSTKLSPTSLPLDLQCPLPGMSLLRSSVFKV